jgi:hypothetical protein
MPGDSMRSSSVRPRRALPSTVQPTQGSSIVLACVAVMVGFGGGLLVAWIAGLI